MDNRFNNNEFILEIVTPTQIGKMFYPILSAKTVNNLLRKAGLQRRVGGEWIPTAEGEKYSRSVYRQLENGKSIYQLKWKRITKNLIEQEL
jgi:hypothetical protein